MNVWAVVMLIAGGLFAGGAATFAWSRAPIWRRMAVPQFVADFAQTIHWTDKVQPALLVVAIVSAIGFTVTGAGTSRMLALLGTAGFVLTLVASFVFLVPLQRRIIASPLERPEAIVDMRGRWLQGNLGRSVVATASFAATAAGAVA